MSSQPFLAQSPSGPVTINNYVVSIDRELCIGAATCMALAPRAYALDGDAKAIIIDSAQSEDISAVIDAAKACPTSAITIKDNNGKVIFPK